MRQPIRLLSIAHSYVVRLNRRLAHEISRVGGEKYEVTMVAPESYPGDLRPIRLERGNDELLRLEAVAVRNARHIHVMTYASSLRRILAEGWDLVHCWEEPFVLSAAQVAFHAPKDASVVYATFQNVAKTYPPPFRWIEEYSMRRANGWIAFGHTIHETLGQREIYAAKPSRIIPLGVDTSRFRVDAEMRAKALHDLEWENNSTPVIGYLGRFTKAKGVAFLTDVLDRVTVEWRALLVGGGELEPALREWAARRPSQVRIVTNARHEEVPLWLNAMDILCAPSLTTPAWREQFGRMLLEAFATQVPVIASDSGEIPRVASGAALIVPEGNHQAWIRAITELTANPALRKELSAAGLERANTRFSWPVVAAQHLEFFEQVISNRGAKTRSSSPIGSRR